MPYKAVHITTAHPPFDIRIFHKECKSLKAAGYDVLLIARNNKEEVVDGIRIIPLTPPNGRFERIFMLTFTAFRIALKEKADIYHFHDPELIPVALLLKLLTKAKVVYDAHEDYPKQILSKHYLPAILRRPISIAFNALEKTAAYFFDAVVTATDDILTNFTHAKKSLSVKNVPILEGFLQCTRKPDNGVFDIIYIGGLSEIRGIGNIIRAMQYVRHDNARLWLYGRFSPDEYEEEIRTLKGYERVSYKGIVDMKEIPSLLSSMDAGIVCFLPEPNHVAAMPNKIFEYMASGLPIIASSFPLWKEIIVESVCGLCANPEDPEEIARAIDKLIENPALRKQMSDNGKRAVIEKYNWDAEAKKLVKTYEEILGL